jgi:hypothetical protein
MALILILSGCSTSQVLSNLQIALDAVSVALPILAGLTGVPAPVVAAVESYVQATNTALGQASTILAGAGTDAQKAAQIAAAFAAIAVPVVPAQYAVLVQLVATLAADVAQFLAGVPAATAAVAHASGATMTKWSTRDREVLAHCTAVANSNAIALAKIAGK